jgi:hypothetical protein
MEDISGLNCVKCIHCASFILVTKNLDLSKPSKNELVSKSNENEDITIISNKSVDDFLIGGKENCRS